MIASRRALGGLALLGSLVAVVACSDTERSFGTGEDGGGVEPGREKPTPDAGGKDTPRDAGKLPDEQLADAMAGNEAEASDASPGSGGADAATEKDSSVVGVDGGKVTSPPDGGPGMSCMGPKDCDDGNSCNGVEGCEDNECTAGQVIADGKACVLAGATGNHFCVAGNCAPGRCGDGVVDKDADEVCDDGDQEPGDGCEPDCKFTCTSAQDCDDSNVCNGDEKCNEATHVCDPGTNLDDGTKCGAERECNSGRCVPAGCGDGVVNSGEQCDDKNAVENDGCRSDCTFTCEKDEQCNDGNACNGTEQCDTVSHACRPGTAVTCKAENECFDVACDRDTGKCISRLKDADGDQHAPSSLGACGDDCDDNDKTVYTGAEELCDNKDNNCNGVKDETAPTWYVDCDGDGFAPADAKSIKQCGEPAAAVNLCGKGQAAKWVTLAPGVGTTDCWDLSSAVHPMTSTESASAWSSVPIAGRSTKVDFDYNCDVKEELRYTTFASENDSCGFVISPAATPADEPTFESQGLIAFCPGAAGYTGRLLPECGASALYTYCLSSCKRTTVSRVQQCR